MDRNESEDNRNDIDQIPNFSDLDRGWSWVVLAGAFGSFMLIGGTIYGVGIIHIALLERYKQDITMTSWIGALHSAMMNLGAPVSTVLVDRYTCRVAVVTSGIFYVVGFLGTAFAPNIEVCIFTCGIVAGLGCAGYTAALVVVGFNFKQKRNLAMGIASSGIGVGLIVMAPLYEFAREFYGNSGFFIALAGINANMIVFGTLCFPSKLERYTEEKLKQDFELKAREGNSCPLLKSVICFYAQVLRKKTVLCLCSCMFCYCLGIHLIFLHFPTYAVHQGSTTVQASFLVSVIGILGVPGRVLAGIAANHEKIDDILVYAGTMGIVALATLLLPFYAGAYAGQAAYSAIFGLYFGCCFVITGSVNIKFVGIEGMHIAAGIEFFCGGIGSVVGPVLAGVMVDNGRTYEEFFLMAGSFILLACFFSVATVAVSFTRKERSETSRKPSIYSVNHFEEARDTADNTFSHADQLKAEEEYSGTRL